MRQISLFRRRQVLLKMATLTCPGRQLSCSTGPSPPTHQQYSSYHPGSADCPCCTYSSLVTILYFHLQEFGCPCHLLWKYLQLDALTNQSGFPLPLSCQALFGKFMSPCWFVNPLNLHLWNLLKFSLQKPRNKWTMKIFELRITPAKWSPDKNMKMHSSKSKPKD